MSTRSNTPLGAWVIPATTPLGAWVITQRQTYWGKNTCPPLSQEQVAALKRIPGWYWSQDELWWQTYESLQRHLSTYGGVYPTKNTDKKLTRWLSHQRHKGRTQLDDQQTAALESLEYWSWSPYVDTWQKHYEAYKAGRPVPKTWLETQRCSYQRGKLSPERHKLVEELLGNLEPKRQAVDYWPDIVEYSKTTGKRPVLPTELGQKLRKIRIGKLISADELDAYLTEYPAPWKSVVDPWEGIREIETFIDQYGRQPSKTGASLIERRIASWGWRNTTKHKDPAVRARLAELLPSLQLVVGTADWFNAYLYKYGDVRPSKGAEAVRIAGGQQEAKRWYEQCLEARRLYQDGGMPDHEQECCEDCYPKIWKWLNA